MPNPSDVHEFLKSARVPYTVVPCRPEAASPELPPTHTTAIAQTDVTICFIEAESGPEIVITGGSRAEVIAIRWSVLAKVLRPFGGDPPPRGDQVGAFRLSHRE